MALVPIVLVNKIREFSDSGYSGFIKFPETEEEAAFFWAEAIKAYFQLLTVPPPLSPTRHEAAAAAFKGVCKGFSAPVAAIAILPAAFAVAAATAAGMSAPIAIPPPAPLIIPPMPPIDSAVVAATVLALAVDTWLKTGMFGIPPAPPVPPWT